MFRLPLLVLLVAATFAATPAPYVVSPQASEPTKTAIASGRAPEHGFPEIYAVRFTSSGQLHPGTSLQASVDTSPNVTHVEGRVKYWKVDFIEIAPGKFTLTYRVPLLPPNALGNWNLEVIARSVDGVETRRAFPVHYSYF